MKNEYSCNSWHQNKSSNPNRLKLLAKMRLCHSGWVLVITAILFLSSGNCYAQHSIEFAALSGAKVFTDGTLSLSGKSYGFEAAYNMFQKRRSAEWIKRLHVRDIAVTGGYYNMRDVYLADSPDSKGFLGSVCTLSGRLNISLISLKKTEMLFAAGVGVAYSSSSFFADGNPIVGSHINFSPYSGIKIRRHLLEATSLVGGVDFLHYSNIGLQVPNKGVNTLHLSLGVIQDLKNTKEETSSEQPDHVKSFIDIGADIGRRGSFQSHGGNWKSGLSLAYNHKLNPVISIKAGVDAVYYYTVFDNDPTGDTFQYLATSYDPWRVGISAGGDLWLGRLAVMGSYGYFLKYNSYYPVKYYSVGGLKYYISSSLGIQTKIYFHRAQADYLGVGMVLRLPIKKFNLN